jgi:CHAT domain-containing protein
LTGASATESAVKRIAPSREILHFATHGLVSEDRPLASSLSFSAGEGEAGFLRVDEVFGMDPHADLVVLSGCSTSDLMDRFYSGLAAGKDKAHALRSAQLSPRKPSTPTPPCGPPSFSSENRRVDDRW